MDSNVHERWDARRERVENEMAEEQRRREIARATTNGVKALQVGVDALAMIAGLGGVQGDWALDALREIRHLIVGEGADHFLAEIAEDSVIPTEAALRLVAEDELEVATGGTRR